MSLDKEKKEKNNFNRKLFLLSEDILRYRIETCNDLDYTEYKISELKKIQHLSKEQIYYPNGINGILGESLFYFAMADLGVPISVSTGEEDMKGGIDFFIWNLPIDVTTNPNWISRKTKPERFTTLLLPKYHGQKVIKVGTEFVMAPEYVSSFIQNNEFSKEQYIQDTLCINGEVLDKINDRISGTNDYTSSLNPGLNNETNLRTILLNLSSLNPEPPSEVSLEDSPALL
jgi:hypothetical protein